jgi:hypothetical protein
LRGWLDSVCYRACCNLFELPDFTLTRSMHGAFAGHARLSKHDAELEVRIVCWAGRELWCWRHNVSHAVGCRYANICITLRIQATHEHNVHSACIEILAQLTLQPTVPHSRLKVEAAFIALACSCRTADNKHPSWPSWLRFKASNEWANTKVLFGCSTVKTAAYGMAEQVSGIWLCKTVS